MELSIGLAVHITLTNTDEPFKSLEVVKDDQIDLIIYLDYIDRRGPIKEWSVKMRIEKELSSAIVDSS